MFKSCLVGPIWLEIWLYQNMPPGSFCSPTAAGAAVLVHAIGMSRASYNGSGLATLLVDLLTTREERIDLHTGEFRFNIGLLAERLIGLTEWQSAHPDLGALSLGYFGASTGSAAALIAAAARPEHVRAVVSRGGRPDMATSSLPRVQAPTLLIVGGDDAPVIELNRQAFEALQCDKKFDIVPGATHLFEEPGALETVAHLAADWYRQHLGKPMT